MQSSKTYSAGSDASVGLAVSDGTDPKDVVKKIEAKVDEWFSTLTNDNAKVVASELTAFRSELQACNADDDTIKSIDDAIDDLNGTVAPELARYPIDQMIAKTLYPEEIEVEKATIKDPENQIVARYLPEDVVALPTIMKIGIVKSYVKIGEDYVYDIQLINDDKMPIGKAIAEESTLIPRSKSAIKHAAMKLISSMEQYVSKVSELVDQIGESLTVSQQSIDSVIQLANQLLADTSLEKRFYRAMQTSQYSLSAAKRILETTGDESLYNDAILTAYENANKVLKELPTSGQTSFSDAGMKAYKSLIMMMRSTMVNTKELGDIILSIQPYANGSKIKNASMLMIAISSLKKARKNSAIDEDRKAMTDISIAAKALKNLVS